MQLLLIRLGFGCSLRTILREQFQGAHQRLFRRDIPWDTAHDIYRYFSVGEITSIAQDHLEDEDIIWSSRTNARKRGNCCQHIGQIQ